MIYGIGCDLVDVVRFEKWKDLPQHHLKKIFSEKELEEAFSYQGNLSLFFASRFAAKEAFFKALCATLSTLNIPYKMLSFAYVRKICHVTKNAEGVPSLVVSMDLLENKINHTLIPTHISLSLSHEKNYALAFVIISDTLHSTK